MKRPHQNELKKPAKKTWPASIIKYEVILCIENHFLVNTIPEKSVNLLP
jgi:hypothetical protein